MLNRLLLFIVLFGTSYLNAQTYYWVGGSGYWNDLTHWSNISGGAPTNTLPSSNDNIVFDDNSSASSFTIHALHSFNFKTINTQNTHFNIDVIGSPNVDLTINGGVNLNEHFFFKLNGKMYLNPQSAVNYQFSHNKFTNDVFLNSNLDISLGAFTTSKSLSLIGDVKLKYSYIIVNEIKLSNNNFSLNNVTIQSKTINRQGNSLIAVITNSLSKIITDKTKLSSTDLNYLNSINGLVLSPLSACFNPPAFGVLPTCSSSCDGKIVVDLSGCTNPPFDLSIGTQCGTPNISISGVAGGSYTITGICGCAGAYPLSITNSLGENGGVLVGVSKPPPSSISFTSILPSCFGTPCDGKIVLKPTFPTATPITAVWSNGVTHSGIVGPDTLKNLCAGSYSVTTTNVNGCVETFTANLTQPILLLANGSSSSVTCNSSCNGSATVAPTGGTIPYSYSWLSASSSPSTAITSTVGNLCAGVVTMTVTDSKACKATYSTTITQPPAITLTVTHTNLICGSLCDGTASVTATGGIGPFTYIWSPSGGSGSQATGLCAGNYTCTVTNNGNCVKTITVTITSPPTLTATPTQTNISCNGLCTGAINLNPSGGTGADTYLWSPVAVPSGSLISNLCVGVYSYTITDASLCKYTNSVTITQPPATTLTIVKTNVICNGACNGTATGTMLGGAGGYTYTWSPGGPPLVGQGTPNASGLCPGTYSLTSKDANGCSKTQTVLITQPLVISPVITTTSLTCNNVCNGSVNSAPTGGTGPYTFTLQSSGAPVTSNPPYTNLCAGSYTLTVKDTKGCIKTQTINLAQPNPITLALSSTTINCFNQCNATISTVVNGGTPLYTFTWSPAGGNGTSLTNQCAGVQSSTVTDSNGCKASASVTITSLPDLTVTIVPTNPNCSGQTTGIATTSVSGGTPNYTISLNNGLTGNIIPGLGQGTYTATVTDFKGCIKTQTFSITPPPAITLTATNGTVSCAGSCDGTISVTASGGTAGYFYNWNSTPSQTTALASGLCVGNYVASVTDALGCIASVAASIVQPSALTASIGNIQPSCNVCIGDATATGIGGTPPYSYAWSGGQNIPNPNTLCVGIQTVIVTDFRGCTTTQTVQINQTVITLITANGSTLICNGGCTGVATANPSGGSGGYTYTWTPAPVAPIQNTQTATGLCFGTHTVTVADALGCSTTNTVTFTNPPAITLTVNQTNVSCGGLCNGTASATAIGGTGALSYLWQPGGQVTSSINGLCAGDYTVTTTDINNCNQTQVVTITENSILTATFTPGNPTTCISNDGSITAVIGGGLPAYTFTWSPGNFTVNPISNIGAGTYSLSIKDAAGCTQTIVTSLSNPTGPTVTVTSSSITCFGACNGSATLSIAGVGPYTFNGTPIAANTVTLSGLCSGITTPIIIDANNCATNQTVNILQPIQLTTNGVVTNANCNSACTASINLTPSGGTLPYSYLWSPTGGLAADPINLCAGNYSVDVTDGNNCTITNTFIVTQPPSLTLTFNKKDVLCNGQCTGGVRAIVSGGTSPYSYTWTAAAPFVTANIDTLVNLCSGIYTVSVSDLNGCVISSTVDIGQPTVLTSTITSINVKCNGQCNGSATVTANGGIGPYSFSYNTTPVTPTQIISGLCVGTYTGNATDLNGCKISTNFIIAEPLPIVITTTVSNPLCNAVCNGSVATTVTGGNPTYSYNWITAGGSVSNPTGMCSGNYTVVVTDDSLCTGQALVVLIDPPILIANTSFTNPTCFAACDGIVSANPIGGTLPFTFSWANPVVNSQTVSNLCAGIFTLTLIDGNGCQDIQTATLINPSVITINPAITPATCGSNNGSINAIASNGLSPYTYNWLNPILAGQATNTLVSGIPAGTYTVVVTDFAGCSTTSVIPLSNSDGPTGTTIASTMVTCNSQCNGAANISNPIGGTAPYVLSWINPVSAASTISGLCAGTYTAQIADFNNCLFFQSVIITEPQTIDDNEVIASPECFGNCNGVIALNPSGGNAGVFAYSWSPAANTGTISNLCPGIYTVTITDVLGCTLVTNYNLPSITTITSSTFAANNTCFGNCNGSILATNIAGGLPPYSFNWTDGQSTAVASSLCNGNYSVTITDANGCFNTLPATVTSPSQVTFTPTVAQPGCGLCNGAAIVNPIGGTPGYSYVWSNGQLINSASNLCAGLYDVQITDGNGCISSNNVIINSSSTITGETITQQNVTCSGVCDGTVTLTAIGGTGIITYNWLHNGSSSQTLNGLCAGTYFCNMTDANGCTRTASIVIGSVTNFTLTPQIAQSACSVNSGSINVNVVGGTGIYSYAWIPAAANSSSLTNLAPGNYTLTVSDGNCIQTQVYSINSINGPIITSTKNDITCSGICDGNISILISGGTPAYTTSWSNGVNATSINGLCAGSYSVSVTDANGCVAVQNFSLSTVTPIVFSIPDIDNSLCNNNCNGVITTIPSGGVLPYTYNWVVSTSTTSVANGLCSGNYSVTVSDANGCSSQETYTLTGPPAISLTAVVTDAKCSGSADGTIDITVIGGTPGVPAYNFTWTPTGAIFTEDLINIAANTYSIHLMDGNGCVVDSSFVVAEPMAIVDNSVITSAACFGNCNGSIGLTPTGGTAPYSYSWTPSASTATITNLCPGPQTATITDFQGCTFVSNYNVPSLTTITSTTIVLNNLCFNDCNGVLTATNIAGGLPPYALQWNDPIGQPGNTAINLCTGSYSVTITDANGCFNKIPADVSSTSQVTFTPNITAPSCNLCNGSAIVNPVGGILPYSYLWSNNQIVNTATGLCSGVYVVQITDGNGCENSTNVVVNNSTGITGETVTSTDVTCAGSCDGTANVTAIGGTGVISYSWVHDNLNTTQTATNLCAGIYFCNMIDATGCSKTASVVIGAVTTLTISSQVTQSSCTASTGSIAVNLTGGTLTYTYSWTPLAPSAPSLTNLAPGNYTLTVSDGNCFKTQVYSINSFSAPVINSTKKDISCNAVCDGNIALTISAGVPTYNTLWSNGATTTSISALCAGAYSVIVTDAAGCSAVQNYSLTTVSPIIFSSPDLNNPQCNDACNGSLTVIPIGGTMPYNYTWTPTNANTANTSSLCAGIYSITVSDINGCPASNVYSITNPPKLSLTAVVTDASCNTALDGAISTTVAGGVAPYNYSWMPGSIITPNLINVLSGTYTLTLTDDFGCVIDSALIINSTFTVNAIAGNDTLFCQNGTLLLDGSNSNGTIGNTYEWFVIPLVVPISNSVITTVSPSVGTSAYVLIATNGVCIDSDTIIVTSNALPIVDAGPTLNIPIFSTASIGGNPTCATATVFNWSPVLGLDNPTGTNPTTATTITTIYTVTVLDANGCNNSDTVTVFIYPEIKIPNGFSPNGDGKNDTWVIDFISQFPEVEVEVYNRWGEKLFYSKGYSVPFNGQFKGKDLPVGTYYYVINLNHPAYPDPYTSPLTIFR